jgi:hypothetical protein
MSDILSTTVFQSLKPGAELVVCVPGSPVQYFRATVAECFYGAPSTATLNGQTVAIRQVPNGNYYVVGDAPEINNKFNVLLYIPPVSKE